MLGRPGAELSAVVWPTPEIRFVAAKLFHPFEGEPRIVVSVIAPELRERPDAKIVVPIARNNPYGLEVSFDREDHLLAEMWTNKCLIVLAAANLEGEQLTRDAFYDRVFKLYRAELVSAAPRAVRRSVARSGEKVVEIKDRDKVKRKSF
jgi:hypothetical protein